MRAGTAAEAAAGGLLGAAVDVDVEVLEPAAWLLEVSADVDLLVCGSRGYGARPATLLGGVTRRLTAGASYPVIVLARGAEVPPEAIALAVPHRCGMQRRTAPPPSTRIEVDAGWVITVEALACAR